MEVPLANLIIVEALEGREAELEAKLSAFVLQCRNLEGCLNYDCFQSLEASRRFMLQIRWRDRESLDRHLSSPELLRFAEQTPELPSTSFLEAYRNFLPET